MEYKPTINFKSRVIIFDLRKPIYGSFYGIWDKWLNIARKQGLKVVVNTELGKSTYTSADDYMDGAERLERFFKNPEVPMVFWGRHFKPDVDQRNKRKKAEKKMMVEDVSIPLSVWERLRPTAKQLGLI